MPQLDFTWYASQVFWCIVSFAIIFTSIKFILLPNLSEIKATREITISKKNNSVAILTKEIDFFNEEIKKEMINRNNQIKLLDIEFKNNISTIQKDLIAENKVKYSHKTKEINDNFNHKETQIYDEFKKNNVNFIDIINKTIN